MDGFSLRAVLFLYQGCVERLAGVARDPGFAGAAARQGLPALGPPQVSFRAALDQGAAQNEPMALRY